MTAIMFDSDDVSVFTNPLCRGSMVATYADLMTPLIEATYLGRLVVIDRGHGDPMNLATVADCETGALTVAQAAAKIEQWHAQKRPFVTGYVNRANWGALINACAGNEPFYWVATLDGTLLPAGKRPAVVQFAGEAALGFHADASIVWEYGWHPVRPAVTWQQIAALEAAAATVARTATLMR